MEPTERQDSGRQERFVLFVPEQGIKKRTFSAEGANEWLSAEISRWEKVGGFTGQLVFGRHQFRVPDPQRDYISHLHEIQKRFAEGSKAAKAWDNLMSRARALQIVIMQGRLGDRILELIGEQKRERAQTLIFVYSEAVTNPLEHEIIEYLRSAAIDSHLGSSAIDLISSSTSLKTAKEAMRESQSLKDQTDEFLKDAQLRLEALEALYHEKLILQGPSRYWRHIASQAKSAKRIAFVSFCALLVAPAIPVWRYWTSLSAYVEHVVGLSAGQFTLGPVIVFTVPVLAYAWLLKHVSRSYVQNLATEADAEHRRVMAATFLGLARGKAVSLEESDRALILNALFRPAPPHSGDDGPPSGLAELLKGRS